MTPGDSANPPRPRTSKDRRKWRIAGARRAATRHSVLSLELFETGQAQITALGVLCDLGCLPSGPGLWEQVGTYPEIHDLFERYGVASVVTAVRQASSKAEIRMLLETGKVQPSLLPPVSPVPRLAACPRHRARRRRRLCRGPRTRRGSLNPSPRRAVIAKT